MLVSEPFGLFLSSRRAPWQSRQWPTSWNLEGSDPENRLLGQQTGSGLHGLGAPAEGNLFILCPSIVSKFSGEILSPLQPLVVAILSSVHGDRLVTLPLCDLGPVLNLSVPEIITIPPRTLWRIRCLKVHEGRVLGTWDVSCFTLNTGLECLARLRHADQETSPGCLVLKGWLFLSFGGKGRSQLIPRITGAWAGGQWVRARPEGPTVPVGEEAGDGE